MRQHKPWPCAHLMSSLVVINLHHGRCTPVEILGFALANTFGLALQLPFHFLVFHQLRSRDILVVAARNWAGK